MDESSSIGANNFIKMKDFIFRVATYFPVIGPQATQVRVSVKTFFYLVTTLSRGGDDIASRFLNSMEKYGIWFYSFPGVDMYEKKKREYGKNLCFWNIAPSL